MKLKASVLPYGTIKVVYWNNPPSTSLISISMPSSFRSRPVCSLIRSLSRDSVRSSKPQLGSKGHFLDFRLELPISTKYPHRYRGGVAVCTWGSSVVPKMLCDCTEDCIGLPESSCAAAGGSTSVGESTLGSVTGPSSVRAECAVGDFSESSGGTARRVAGVGERGGDERPEASPGDLTALGGSVRARLKSRPRVCEDSLLKDFLDKEGSGGGGMLVASGARAGRGTASATFVATFGAHVISSRPSVGDLSPGWR